MTISWGQVYFLIANMWFASMTQSRAVGVITGFFWLAAAILEWVLENRGNRRSNHE